MNIKSYATSHIGMVRTENEDSFLEDLQEKLFMVADGMGGTQGGAFASENCIKKCQDYLLRNWEKANTERTEQTNKLDILSEAVNLANTFIYQISQNNTSLEGMGTTLTLLKVEDNSAYWAHVGDSRLYLLRDMNLQQLTRDHTLPQEQLRLGQISEEEFQSHTLHHVLIRAVGIKENVVIDTQKFLLQKKDTLLLCSDGLHNLLSEEEIKSLLLKKNIKALDELIKLANNRGGHDNMTAVGLYLF